MPYKDIAYAKLNLDFDHKLFALEYDKLILPHARPIVNSQKSWQETRRLNQTWGMVDPSTYDKCSIGLTGHGKSDTRESPQWDMVQLLYLKTTDDDPEILKQQAEYGGVFARNMALDREWLIKAKFEKLKIIKFIKTLPLKTICSIHCVSLEPGRFASIHRDSRWFEDTGDAVLDRPNVALHNGVIERGFVIITLNISDGGVPLYWAFDGQYVTNALYANDPVYLTSDYFLHGVPVCTSRRRQIRITGRPTDQLNDIIDQQTKVVVPKDMVYATGKTWYPG